MHILKLQKEQVLRVRAMPEAVHEQEINIRNLKTYDTSKVFELNGILPGVNGKPWSWMKGSSSIAEALEEGVQSSFFQMQ
jgi:hypothetical protein